MPGVSGTWKDLTDNVNFMASNLTTQVRGIVKVVTAVANGDLSQKLVGVEAKGEIAALADTLNSMTKTLGIFAEQVTTRRAHRRRRGQARRAGRGARRRRHLEGPDRQRQPAGEQPDRAGAQHRRGHDRGRDRRPVEEDHRRRQGRDPRAQEHHQHDGRSAARRSRARSPASRRRSAPRASWAARPTSRASAAPGRT